jgi:hypothetical protein
MASANLACDLKVVVEDAFGNQFVCNKFRSDGAINAGKSPDGVLANMTHDKQVKVGMAGPIAKGGSKIRLFASLDAADGSDASDCVVQIAVTEVDRAGRPISERQLSDSDLGHTVDLPAATPATSWVELGTGYTVPDGMFLRVGSASMQTPTVISIEDDA